MSACRAGCRGQRCRPSAPVGINLRSARCRVRKISRGSITLRDSGIAHLRGELSNLQNEHQTALAHRVRNALCPAIMSNQPPKTARELLSGSSIPRLIITTTWVRAEPPQALPECGKASLFPEVGSLFPHRTSLLVRQGKRT